MPSCAACNSINWFAKQDNKSTKTSFARVISNLQLKGQFKSLLFYIRLEQDPGEYRCHSLTSDPNIHSFLLLKDGGVFQKPSAGIIAVFTESESCFKELWEDLWQASPRTRFSISCQDWRTMLQRWQKKKKKTIKNCSQGWFYNFNTTVEDNHWHLLAKMAAGIYWSIRMNHLAHELLLGGGHVTAGLESPMDCSLPTPGTAATENGLVCMCLQGWDLHAKHMQKRRNAIIN